jgi:methylthioribose-1-phosphate isomerase
MRSVEWHGEKVRMIDQRLLPAEFHRVEYEDYRDVAQAIHTMVIRGAPAIGAAAAFGMALAARQSSARDREGLLADLREAGAILCDARPTAVNLSWAVARLLRRADSEADFATMGDALLSEAQALADEDVETNKRLGEHGAALVRDGDIISSTCWWTKPDRGYREPASLLGNSSSWVFRSHSSPTTQPAISCAPVR